LPSGARSGKSTSVSVTTTEEFMIFPNPTNGVFSITSKNNMTPKSVSVYNLNGVIMDVKGSVNEIDLSNLSKGVYTIRIQTDNGFTDKKIIKQ
jgi:hypothetical protein